jgi:hypothetical protein
MKYLQISFEIGWWREGMRYSAHIPTLFLQQAAGQIFKDDVDVFLPSGIFASRQSDDLREERGFSRKLFFSKNLYYPSKIQKCPLNSHE